MARLLFLLVAAILHNHCYVLAMDQPDTENKDTSSEADPRGMPLNFLATQQPTDVTMRFGLQFIEELRTLRQTCEQRLAEVADKEANEEVDLQKLESMVDEVMKDPQFENATEEEKSGIKESLVKETEEKLKEENAQATQIERQCDAELQQLMADRMLEAVNFARFIQANENDEEYVLFLTEARDYRDKVRVALDQCREYHAEQKTVNIAETCFTNELTVVMNFITTYIEQLTEVTGISIEEEVSGSGDDSQSESHHGGPEGDNEQGDNEFDDKPPVEDNESDQSPSETTQLPTSSDEEVTGLPEEDGDVDEESPTVTEVDETATIEEPDLIEEETTSPPVTEEETTAPVTEEETTAPVTEEETTAPVTEEETTAPVTEEETTAPVTEEETTSLPVEPSTSSPEVTDSIPEDSSNSEGGQSTESTPTPEENVEYKPDPSHRPPFDNKPLPHFPDNTVDSVDKPGNKNSTDNAGQVDVLVNGPQPSVVIVEDVEEDHSMMIILVAFSAVIILLVVAISVVAVLIGLHKYRISRAKEWAQMDDKQKVEKMKESGYINPTYQFFDRVTQ